MTQLSLPGLKTEDTLTSLTHVGHSWCHNRFQTNVKFCKKKKNEQTQLRVSQKLERLNSPCDSLDSPSVNIHKDVVKNIKVLLKYFIIINNNIINYYYLLLFIITPLYFYKHNDENVMLTLACRARLQI